MPAEVRIDTMTDGDVVAVAAIEPSAQTEEARLREELARPWARLWVARDERGERGERGDGAVVAFLASWHVTDELHVINVLTRADRRRTGIARALMQTLVAYGREKRARHVLLEVRRSNDGAIALYRSIGFFATGVRARYYDDDEDAVEMVLSFDPKTGEVAFHEDEVRLDSSIP
jgi:[ribosomal protein S18]-alanine N-acetyltransferase